MFSASASGQKKLSNKPIFTDAGQVAFRAISRPAQRKEDHITSSFSYTTEILIRRAASRWRSWSVFPVRTNGVNRPSRLFKSVARNSITNTGANQMIRA